MQSCNVLKKFKESFRSQLRVVLKVWFVYTFYYVHKLIMITYIDFIAFLQCIQCCDRRGYTGP